MTQGEDDYGNYTWSWVFIGLVIAFWVWRRQRRKALVADVRQRMDKLKQMADNPPQLHQPEDDDLDPALEYMNVSKVGDETRWNLVIFNTNGIVEKRLDLGGDFIDTFVEDGKWQRVSDQYKSSDQGLQMMMHFRRHSESPPLSTQT